jgi:TolB-like protein
MALSSGSRLGPYEIIAPLGAGGMGEVYRARDKKLDRDVAVKVLPQSVAADPDTLARFEREAKSVAALSHPNILAIHDFGNHDGIAYAVMELLEGETLRGKLDASPITEKQAVDYALQVARGLSAAHEKGIVHRDLKPENLFVSRDGHVKILDFGLAKRIEAVAPGKETSAPTGSGHTEPGAVMGTVGYMSPEQVKGFPVDHRSDIFSFGAILYELLSGKKAFKRDTNAETIAAILMSEPPELSESGRNIAPALDRIVKHCLDKDRERRFQTARDIAFSLSEQSSPAAGRGAREIAPPAASEGFWVAVLPFKYSGANADLGTLAEGLTEDIVTGLSRFSYLRVIARSSTTRYSSESGDVRAIGKELGARYVMEGSLRQAGTRLRLAVQLVDALSGAHLWAENFERTFSPETVFELQDDLVPRIVSTVADMYGVLTRSMSETLRGKADEELTPHEAVLSAFGYMERVTPEEHARVRRILERAVRVAPNQSDAWAMLANLYWEEHAHGLNPQPDPLGRALVAARRAVEAAPSNNLAHYALASTLFFQKDFLAFRSAAERAIELNRMDASVAAYIGNLIAYAGDWERGCAVVQSAMQLNPRHPGWYYFASFNDAYRRRDYRGALGFALKINLPGNFYTHAVIAAAYGQLGMREEARKALQELLAIRPDFAKTAREEHERWFPDLVFVEHTLNGLRKAGLEIPDDPPKPSPSPAAQV